MDGAFVAYEWWGSATQGLQGNSTLNAPSAACHCPTVHMPQQILIAVWPESLMRCCDPRHRAAWPPSLHTH